MHGSQIGESDRIVLPDPSVALPRLTSDRQTGRRVVAEEVPVALVYDGTTAAVVMATPDDLNDLAVGFSLTEGIIRSAGQIEALDVVPHRDGIELRMWLTADCRPQFSRRQRRLVGPTGCGLCGVESLSEAVRPLPQIKRTISLHSHQIESAVAALSRAQALNELTHATHAAGFYLPDGALVAIREDVGRHNALDKLAGALADKAISGGTGAIVLTSRVSIELVQKAAMMGCPILIAISAPTALAVRTADACGITLVAVARSSAFEIFSHPDGIAD
jgi:FdhD protein